MLTLLQSKDLLSIWYIGYYMAFLKSHPILVRGCLILAKLRVVIGSRTANIQWPSWKANMWCTIKKCHVHGFYIIYLQKISKKQYKPSCGWGLIIVNSSLGHYLLLKCLINFPVNLCQLLICLITKMMST